MRSVPTDILTELNKRQGIKIRNLYWVRAKNRTTGAEETIGVWNGEDTRQFTIGTETRTYVGGGGFLTFGSLKHSTGLNIQRLVLNANPLSPEFINTIRLYEAKGAAIECHTVFFDTENDQVIATPQRVFKGWINTAPIKEGEKGSQSTLTINHVGHARLLTRLNPGKRSDDTQRLRLSGDKFFQYVAISGSVQTAWGSKIVPTRANYTRPSMGFI